MANKDHVVVTIETRRRPQFDGRDQRVSVNGPMTKGKARRLAKEWAYQETLVPFDYSWHKEFFARKIGVY